MFFCKQTKYQFDCATTSALWSSKARHFSFRFDEGLRFQFSIWFCFVSEQSRFFTRKLIENLVLSCNVVTSFTTSHFADSIWALRRENPSSLTKRDGGEYQIWPFWHFLFLFANKQHCWTKEDFMHRSMRSHAFNPWPEESCQVASSRNKFLVFFPTFWNENRTDNMGSEREKHWEEATNNTKKSVRIEIACLSNVE